MPSNVTEEQASALFRKSLDVYPYGSSVYGTLTENSDRDYIVTVRDDVDLSDYENEVAEYISKENHDYQFVKISKFQKGIKDNHLPYLECMFLDHPFVYPYFKLDKWKLRESACHISSNSFVKAKKKMTVEKDYDLYKAKKSLFHSLRVLIFAIQIAEQGRITDYKAANYIWEEIKDLDINDWDYYKQKYKPLQNELHSKLVELCPKPIEDGNTDN